MATPSDPVAAEKEAYEYWGYLFKTDKTGTEKLKKLLRSLHRHIVSCEGPTQYGKRANTAIQGIKFEPYDSRDVTPSQLAHFYRELNGNYDQLFLSTPPATIAFIYKNLGCLHSLQPLPSSGADKRFSEPSIPALKVEGWIMWETIQLLLGPEEHAGFLMEAVRKWDLRDPDTGDKFPKFLPRACFPAAPDPHMSAWYEGMGERLRREAEEEQNLRVHAIDDEPRQQIESGERPHRRHEREHGRESDGEMSDSKKSSALAYFKNPLFRNNEGRPGVVRRQSKHPTLMERGMSAASSVTQVVRNIGSPHLWDGGGNRERSYSHREKDRDRDPDRDDRDRRRKSLPHNHHSSRDIDEDRQSPRMHPRQAALSSRRGSAANSPMSEKEHRDHNSSTNQTPTERHHHRQASSPVDPTIRHSKSHDPTPSPKDYFPPYESYKPRRGSAHLDAQSPGGTTTSHSRTVSPSRVPPQGPGSRDPDVHAGFMPTASPLFATQVARGGYHQQGHMSRSSAHERYESPARSPMGRSSSVRKDEGRRDSARPSATSPTFAPGKGVPQRPKVARFEAEPVSGVQGRQYVREGQWR